MAETTTAGEPRWPSRAWQSDIRPARAGPWLPQAAAWAHPHYVKDFSGLCKWRLFLATHSLPLCTLVWVYAVVYWQRNSIPTLLSAPSKAALGSLTEIQLTSDSLTKYCTAKRAKSSSDILHPSFLRVVKEVTGSIVSAVDSAPVRISVFALFGSFRHHHFVDIHYQRRILRWLGLFAHGKSSRPKAWTSP